MTKISKILLQVAVAIVLVIGTVVVTMRFIGKEGKRHPPLVELKDGQTVTKKHMEDVGISTPEPKAVNTGRLQATYVVGKTYVNLLKATATSKGSHKDWGIHTDMTFNYGGQFQFNRYIVANDGRKLTIDLKIDRACTTSVYTKVEGIQIALGGVSESMLEIGGDLIGVPPGMVVGGKSILNTILSHDLMKDYISNVLSDKEAKLFASIESLQGKKARIEFENGKGVISITAIGCTLSADEEVYLNCLSLVSDVTMMEKVDYQPGDTWIVDAKDCIPMLDPSLKATTSGSVTIKRGKDLGQADDKEALLQIIDGVFQLNDIYQGKDNKVKRAGSWAPKGDLVFNFNQMIVTEAKLSGAVDFVEKSLDHVLFEMKHVQKPVYEISYAGWILDGDKLNETPKIKRNVKEGTLDALKRKFSQKR